MPIMMHKDRPGTKNNKEHLIVGQLGDQTVFQMGYQTWGLKVAKGMDPALSIIFCIAVEDLNREG